MSTPAGGSVDFLVIGQYLRGRMIRSALIMCFGDSLTAGFQSPTPDNPMGRETPYGRFLQDHLGSAAMVQTSGVCGELTSDMLLRLRHDVLLHKPDFVPILGGTNDLGWNVSPEEILVNLVNMYEQILDWGGRPLPVTVPSIRVEGYESSQEGREWVAGHLGRRKQLNQLILDHAVSANLASVDLFSATVDTTDGQLAGGYSNDGLHLTTAGYRLFAEQVAKVLKPFLSGK